jgi:hypothetical protein
MARLLTSKKLLRSSVSFSKRVFDKKTSKAKEARIHMHFPQASGAGTPRPVTYPHHLGFTPSSYTVVATRRNTALGPPGQVFDVYPWATPTHVTFHCSAAGTVAEIVLR